MMETSGLLGEPLLLVPLREDEEVLGFLASADAGHALADSLPLETVASLNLHNILTRASMPYVPAPLSLAHS